MASTTRGRSNRFLLLAILLVSAVVFVGVLTLVQKTFETETYYTLNQDVPTRTQVTAEMLSPVTTSKGTAPEAAIGLGEVQGGAVFTQYPLHAGDILTTSNVVNGLTDISAGVPDTWVVTNFSVSADNAVGGRIQRGFYFDIMVATADGAFYPFVNILALDTTVDLDNASSSNAADTEEAHAGQTTQYVVGMPPGDAARLQNIMEKHSGNVKLVMSPRANEYQRPQLADYSGVFSYEQGSDGTIWPGKSDKGELTDYTFTQPERDQMGRPVKKIETCSEGNAKISGDACNAAPAEAPQDGGATPSPAG